MGDRPAHRQASAGAETSTSGNRTGFGYAFLLRIVQASRAFWRDDCIDRASLLAYTSLLALVPSLAVAFSLWSVVGLTDERRDMVDRFLFQSLMPQTAGAALHWLNLLAARGATLGWYGIGGLAITGLLLIHEIERHFNAIWQQPIACQWCRPLRYLLFLIVGPLALAVLILFLGPLYDWLHRFAKLPSFPAWAKDMVGFFVEMAMLLLVYRVLPAAQVRLRDAFWGALMATLLLSLAKVLLALYVQYSTTQTLYGALGLLPVFLLWLYMVWIAVLFGAEFAAAAAPKSATH